MDTAREDVLESEISESGDREHDIEAEHEDHLATIEDAGIGSGMTSGEGTAVQMVDNTHLAQFIVPDAGNLEMSFYSEKRRGAASRKARRRACTVL